MAIAVAFPLSLPMMGAATIVINNINGAGVGFNDATSVAAVGGNAGTTLGQQRLNAFQHAASIWGATLSSSVTIVVNAQFSALTCTATSAVLGSAGAVTVHGNFLGAPISGTWYSQALANKLFGSDLDGTNADISANFNVNLGNAGCLTGTPFYLGLDNNHGASIDLVAVLLHEFGHGLGFQTFTSGTTGAYFSSFPSAWDHFLMDNILGLTWVNMSASQRVTSAVGINRLVWSGSNVTSAVPSLLTAAPAVIVTAPASVAASFAPVGTAAFGPAVTLTGVTGEVMPVVDQTNGTGLACTALSSLNAAAVSGKIALIDRGTCGFAVKVKNAQNAGATGVIMANNAAGVIPMGGTDATITIPSLMISQTQGNTLKTALRNRSRTRSGMFARLGLDSSLGYAGADSSSRPLMYTPSPFQSGSSVSHFDSTASPNLLMEPAINGDLTHSVNVPQDLTFKLLKDLGW